MSQHKNEISVLNQLLKLLYQTIAQYDIYILRTSNEETIRNILQKIQKQHHGQIGHIVDLIQELKGNPHNSPGLNQGLKELKRKLTLFNPKKILDQAMQDEELLIQTFDQAKQDVSENIKIRIKDFIRETKAIVKRLYQTKMDFIKNNKK